MNRKYQWIAMALLLLLLMGCARSAEEIAIDKTRSYIQSMGERDLDTQMELLEAFSPEREDLVSFLSHVINTEERSLQVTYEDRQVIIIHAQFMLELADSAPKEGRFQAGTNEVSRYFAYYKNRDMQLREILDQLIK